MDFPGGQAVPPGSSQLLELPCDVLIPAALGGVITGPVAQRLNCRWGLPGCHGMGWHGRIAVSDAGCQLQHDAQVACLCPGYVIKIY